MVYVKAVPVLVITWVALDTVHVFIQTPMLFCSYN